MKLNLEHRLVIMKSIKIILLRILVVIVGICALTFMLWEPQIEGRNINATFFEIYFNDTFLAYAYIASIPFFMILYKVYKIPYMEKGKIFKAILTIKSCALAMIGFVIVGEVFIVMNDSDDRAGGIFMGILVILGSIVIFVIATKLERALRK